MIRNRILATGMFALVLGLGAAATTSAYALPHLGVHRHPASQKDERVTVHLRNKATFFRDVKIGDKVYTVLANHGLTIKAPAGTQIFAASPGVTYRKGDLLFAINPHMENATVSIN
jgi:hypothetical protein